MNGFCRCCVSLCAFIRYQSINTESKAFKAKLSPLVGPLALLKAVGFEKVEGESKLQLVNRCATVG